MKHEPGVLGPEHGPDQRHRSLEPHLERLLAAEGPLDLEESVEPATPFSRLVHETAEGDSDDERGDERDQSIQRRRRQTPALDHGKGLEALAEPGHEADQPGR